MASEPNCSQLNELCSAKRIALQENQEAPELFSYISCTSTSTPNIFLTIVIDSELQPCEVNC